MNTESDVFQVADLHDEFGGQICRADFQFRSFGLKTRFFGPVYTVKVNDDSGLVKTMLAQEGAQRVLVVDNNGSANCAMMGEIMARLAIENNWSGLLIHGYIRDSAPIGQLPIGVKSMGTCPVKPNALGAGDTSVSLSFAGVNIHPGDWIYSDEDGILVSDRQLV
ncbi:MAG: ribonuclease E activity regulator RraA [Pseudomonadota bacterium]